MQKRTFQIRFLNSNKKNYKNQEFKKNNKKAKMSDEE